MEPTRNTGLEALAALLPDTKALLARRLLAAGRKPVAADFDEKGLTLAPDELAVLRSWIEDGLRTRVVCSLGKTRKIIVIVWCVSALLAIPNCYIKVSRYSLDL